MKPRWNLDTLDDLSIYEPLVREHLKVGSGIACCTRGLRNTGLVMEAVILISEILELTSSCFRPCGAKSEVYFFSSILHHLSSFITKNNYQIYLIKM